MEAMSVRDYQNNMASSFARADRGEKVLIRRNNHIYALSRLEEIVTPELQERIDKARKDYKEGKTLHFDSAANAIKWMEEL